MVDNLVGFPFEAVMRRNWLWSTNYRISGGFPFLLATFIQWM